MSLYMLLLLVLENVWHVYSYSDVKFHEIFWREIFHDIFREIFF